MENGRSCRTGARGVVADSYIAMQGCLFLLERVQCELISTTTPVIICRKRHCGRLGRHKHTLPQIQPTGPPSVELGSSSIRL